MNLSDDYQKRLRELSGIIQEDRKRVDYLRGKFISKMPAYQRAEAEKTFRQIVASDPSENKQYSQWLLNLFLYGQLKLEDLYKATEYLYFFDELKRKNIIPVEKKDIGQFKSLQELYELISELGGTGEIKEDEKYLVEDRFFINNGQAQLVFENGRWLAVIPRTFEASQFYGCSSQWCTKFPEQFANYSKDGPLLVIIDKSKLNERGNDRRFQFHVPSDQFMDFSDSSINLNDFLKYNPDLTSGLSKFIIDAIESGFNVFNSEEVQKLRDKESRYLEFEILPPDVQHLILKRITDRGLIVNRSWLDLMDEKSIPAYIDNRLRKNGVNGFEGIWDLADNRQKVYYFKVAASKEKLIPEDLLKKADDRLVRFYLDEIAQKGKILPDYVYNMFYTDNREKYLNYIGKIGMMGIAQVSRKQVSDLGDDRSKKIINRAIRGASKKYPLLLTNEFFNGLSDNVKNYYIGMVYQKYNGDETAIADVLTKHQLQWGREYGFLS